MFRIVFDPKISRFVVQVMVWHCFWRDCQQRVPTGDGPTTRAERVVFHTYKGALKWVTDNGLKEAYREAPSNIHVLYPETR